MAVEGTFGTFLVGLGHGQGRAPVGARDAGYNPVLKIQVQSNELNSQGIRLLTSE